MSQTKTKDCMLSVGFSAVQLFENLAGSLFDFNAQGLVALAYKL